MTGVQRAKALLYLARYFGMEVTARFLQKTREECPGAGIEQIHPLFEGIYKPADSPYVFCIWSRSAAGAAEEAYPDSFEQLDDGTWQMRYAPKKGPLDKGVNRALFRCMEDHVPVLAIVTTRSGKTAQGARYRLWGMALLTDFDPMTRHFILQGCSPATVETLRPVVPSETELEEVSLRNGLVLPFKIGGPRERYVASRQARNQAFRKLILEEYRHQCSVCQSMFLLREPDQELVEAEAAHIIEVESGGPDDPRNGLSLCRRHHWAFDNRLFCINDALEVKVSPAVGRANREKFDLEEYDRQPLTPPVHESCRPSLEALAWRRDHRYRAS